jgi:DNA-binding GntR family transcriptional regulator
MTSMRKEVTHEGGDIRAMLRARDRFCEVLLEGSGSKSIYSIPGGLQGRVSVPRTTALSQAGRPAQAVGEVRAIVEAIEAQDAEAAALACARHVELAAEAGLAGLGADAHTEAARTVR